MQVVQDTMQVIQHKFRFNVILLLYKYINEDITKSPNNSRILKKALQVIKKLPEIDEIITKCLIGYSITRLHKLDLSIIRYATYEMLFDKLSPRIVINEAVEITKKYCDLDDGKQHAFTNALLDNIRGYIENA